MGRASRKRAEQRHHAPERLPGPADRSTSAPRSPVERLERLERSDLRVERADARRPPFRHPPPAAHGCLHRLNQLRAARSDIESAISREIDTLVALGTDWGSIGRALGVSRQAARQRYGPGRP